MKEKLFLSKQREPEGRKSHLAENEAKGET